MEILIIYQHEQYQHGDNYLKSQPRIEKSELPGNWKYNGHGDFVVYGVALLFMFFLSYLMFTYTCLPNEERDDAIETVSSPVFFIIWGAIGIGWVLGMKLIIGDMLFTPHIMYSVQWKISVDPDTALEKIQLVTEKVELSLKKKEIQFERYENEECRIIGIEFSRQTFCVFKLQHRNVKIVIMKSSWLQPVGEEWPMGGHLALLIRPVTKKTKSLILELMDAIEMEMKNGE
jgi:hypothetical protein